MNAKPAAAAAAPDLSKLVIKGRQPSPPRILVYGMEGIGKSTFGANCPNPFFIATEDGLDNIHCSRFPTAKSYQEFEEYLKYRVANPEDYQTLVIDSLDWLERLIWEQVCEDEKVTSIEKISYGKGYVIALYYWRQILDLLSEWHEGGHITLLVAHAVAENYVDPEVTLTRFAPRLHKHALSFIAEYVDVILLATRKVGAAMGGVNNPRIVRSDTSPSQMAKSRFAIPAEMPLDANVVLRAIQEAQK